LSRERNIPLHQALDDIAVGEGFPGWSLLAQTISKISVAQRLYSSLDNGDLVLIGARPGQGKTLMSLELAIEAMKAGHRSFFFSLEYLEQDVRDRFRAVGADWQRFEGVFEFDSSDAISADYIVRRLAMAAPGTLAVIDYLQILDQKQENPPLMTQIRTLKLLARERGLILVFISQIDRGYNPAVRPFPDLGHVRLPNPLDLTMFDKICFISNGDVEFRAAA
jgi:replicative DNA helicase